ncbi:hypothetical protein PYK79_19060 [Streptomyces sp. ID05-04B]|uniref:hypothetical protein n=1 Tax=Streptomyces sp. ID05-04B TaxID=3028661 RepID=UPI0029C2E95D|nr:hypothetical protein [Streptomyces sp. ID05-04B]MDX5564990.1 hypothetical protein [Streptomyces sp. ID05-04B]
MRKQILLTSGTTAAALALFALAATVQSPAEADAAPTATVRSAAESGAGLTPVYPYDVTDTSHASRQAAAFFRSYFTAKTLRNVDAFMNHFRPSQTAYYDATLGWGSTSYAQLKGGLPQTMAAWGKDGKAYPVRIVGDTHGAVVEFTDTKPLFGDEIRGIAAVDFRDGKIVRQADYWDGRHNTVANGKAPADQYPTDLGATAVKENSAPAIERAARMLNAALAADNPQAAAALFSTDATFEDAATRTSVQGQLAIGRYLERALPNLPYGPGTTVRHVLGSSKGGGYEWKTSATAVRNGITMLELDRHGLITNLTTTWDASGLSDSALKTLATLAIEN